MRRWEDVPERVRPKRRREKFVNPDRRQTACPTWGHMGPTKRGVMKGIAGMEGRLLELEQEAANYQNNIDAPYFREVRDKAERLMKFIKAEGGAIGWSDVEAAIREREAIERVAGIA